MDVEELVRRAAPYGVNRNGVERMLAQRDALNAQRDNAVRIMKDLALELEIRNAPQLLQAARQRGVDGATPEAAAAALRDDTAAQVLVPPQRPRGKSAAEGPSSRFQIDLLDFAQNARTERGNKYALLLVDVYSREAYSEALPDKSANTVNDAARRGLSKLDADQSFAVTSDRGKEFSRLEQVLPDEAVHRYKNAVQDISVLDRTGMKLKRDMAAASARRKTEWDGELDRVVRAYNRRPHGALWGNAPRDVENNEDLEWYVLQDNAQKIAHNERITRERVAKTKTTMTVRPPLSRGRSWNYSYGNPARVTKIASDWLTLEDGKKALLKEALLGVPEDARAAVGTLTDPTHARRARMQDVAAELEAYVENQGEPVRVSTLEQDLSRNAILPRLKARLAQASLSLRGFLRLHANTFRVQRGFVALANPPESAAPDAPAAPVEQTPFLRFLNQSRAQARPNG